MVANAGLNWFLIAMLDMDHRGLALSTSCTMTLSLGALWFLLRRRSGLGGLEGRAALAMMGKMIVASAIMGVVAAATSEFFDSWLGHEALLPRLAQVGASIGLALVVLYGACKVLRVGEMDQAMRALAGRGREMEVP